MRRPIVVAVANFVFPGLGYVLLGKRVIFGWLLMIMAAIQDTQLIIDPLRPYFVAYGTFPLSVALGFIAICMLLVCFAVDAYELAKGRSGLLW